MFFALILTIVCFSSIFAQSKGRVGRETIFALTTGNRLISFNSTTPGTVINTVSITGLQAGESLVGMDFRPATRTLFSVSNMGRVYTINTNTGLATQVGMQPVAINGTNFGVDFNPSPDRIRFVSNTGQDLRLNPNDGTLAATDGMLAYAMGDPNNGRTPNAFASAYTNNFAGVGGTATTLYNIDSDLDILITQGSLNSAPVSPNSGQLFTVGALGINVTNVGGMDISDVNGTAFAAFTLNGEMMSKLYTINLATGAASLVGNIGGTEQIRDIAVVVNGETLIGITGTNRVVTFNSTAPGTILSSTLITGLSMGETIVGADFRPATGDFYALANTGQVYIIRAATGAAIKVGTPNFTLMGSEFGVDFNPAPDRIRVVSNMGQNLRLNPDNGTLAGTDGTLAYAMGDTNESKTPRVITSAYSNNFAGVSATGTTLYGIDSTLDILVTQGSVNSTPVSPNTGQLFTVGPLGVDASDITSLDISDASGLAYATITLPGEAASRLYRINLTPANATTPVATQVGMVGGTEQIRSLGVVLRVENILGLTNDNRLVRFNPRKPDTFIGSPIQITGLQMGESLLGIDFRPATGFLFGLGSSSRIYTISTTTGVATALGGAPFIPALAGMEFGFDFNPVPDRIRVVSNTTQDLRLNPNNGGIAAVDGTLAYAMGDANMGQTPSCVASAYTNSFPGTVTTLYNIDSKLDILVTQGSVNSAPVSPNSGQLLTVGRLGIDIADAAAFDISESSGIAYASLVLSGETTSRFYTINLATGAATAVGTLPVGGMTPVVLRDMAVINNVGLSVVATAPATALSGNNFTYTLAVANANPNDLSNVVLSTATPANTTFQSITAPTGFTCMNPSAGGTGAITCTGTLSANSSGVFSLVVTPNVTMNGTNVSLMAMVRSDTPDVSGIRFDNTTSSATTMVNIPGPTVMAANIKVTNMKITATGTGFSGTTVLVDGVGFAKAAKLASNNTKLTQKGKLTNGMSINQAIPKGRSVMITFRNSNGGVTVVPFTRQ